MVPGPGAYEHDYTVTVKKEPGWRIGTASRNDQEKIKLRTCDFPPMNKYDPNYHATIKALPKWGFGSSQRSNLAKSKMISPSMQTYNIPSKAVEGRQQCMGLKLNSGGAIDNGKQKNTPGPGNYDPDYTAAIDKKPSFSMKGRYAPQKKLNVPGPGTYNKSFVD